MEKDKAQISVFKLFVTFIGYFLRNSFKSDNRDNQREDEKQSPKGCRLVKNENAKQYGTHSSNASPNRVGGANGKWLRGFGEQYHTQNAKE